MQLVNGMGNFADGDVRGAFDTDPSAVHTAATTSIPALTSDQPHFPLPPAALVRKDTIISISDGILSRDPGFLKIVKTRVSVLNSNLQQIGPEVALDSICCGASRWINGVWVKIGPETKELVKNHRDFRREPSFACACDVV
jgi:hypothetical protein